MTNHPFRFLDLPAELRCLVYEQIDLPSRHHVLTRTNAQLSEEEWPVPTESTPESSVTFVVPVLPVNVLTTCRLVNKEARPILLRRVESLLSDKAHFLVDFAAANALLWRSGALHACLENTQMSLYEDGLNQCVEKFVAKCSHYAKRSQRITVTIVHKEGIVYGEEAFRTLYIYRAHEDDERQIDIVYKAPYPACLNPHSDQVSSAAVLERFIHDHVNFQEAMGDFAHFISLDAEAFEKHLSNLNDY